MSPLEVRMVTVLPIRRLLIDGNDYPESYEGCCDGNDYTVDMQVVQQQCHWPHHEHVAGQHYPGSPSHDIQVSLCCLLALTFERDFDQHGITKELCLLGAVLPVSDALVTNGVLTGQ